MNVNLIRKQYLEAEKAEIMNANGTVCLEFFGKAIRKAERWMIKAFGGIDWAEMQPGTVVGFYADTLRDPLGKKTFNRGRSL